MALQTLLSPLAATVAAALLLAAGVASAQSLYRSVGPDGRISYSDRAPAAASATAQRQLEPAAAAPAATLPYELREVSNRYPVTLYTAADCAPCASARVLLTSRGVPFTERTIASNEDIAAVKALSGDASLPYGTVGSQPLRGFSESEWQRNLDAAGYPKTSQLPANWRAAAATPLVQRVSAQTAAPAVTPQRPDSLSTRSGDAGSSTSNKNNNPAGIRF